MDELLYFQGSDGVEHALAGQVQPFALFDGNAVTVSVQNASMVGVAIIRQPAGAAAGDYQITLPFTVTGALGVMPAPSNGKWPRAVLSGGTDGVITADIVGSSFPYTQVRVRSKDHLGVAANCTFYLTFDPF